MLTPRELEVLTLVCRGFTNIEIAEELCISSHTAKAHVCSIIRKFGVDNRTLVACYAIKNNLVKLDI